MNAFANLVSVVIEIYIWALIASAILSWLATFNVVNRNNRAVAAIGEFLWRITEPALRPIRRFVPLIGGVDVSPVVLILLLWFARNLLFEILF